VYASAVEIIVRIFSAAFLIGAVCCGFVIPIVAFSLCSVLFEPDRTATSSSKPPVLRGFSASRRTFFRHTYGAIGNCALPRKKPRG
jgi:hypothetical protein